MCNTTYSIHTCVYRISYVQPVTPLESPRPPKNDQAYFRQPKKLFSSPKRKAELTSPCSSLFCGFLLGCIPNGAIAVIII